MRTRSLAKRERELRGELLAAASRLLPTAEKQAAEGRPHLLRTIVAIAQASAGSEAAKKRLELTRDKLQVDVEWKQKRLETEEGERTAPAVDTDFAPPDTAPDGVNKPLDTDTADA